MQSVIKHHVLQWSKSLYTSTYKNEKSGLFCEHEALEACKLLPFKIVSFVCFGELLEEASNLDVLLSLIGLHDKIFAAATFNNWAKYDFYQFLVWTNDNKNLAEYKNRWREFCIHMVGSSREQCISTPVTETYVHVENGDITENEWLESTLLLDGTDNSNR